VRSIGSMSPSKERGQATLSAQSNTTRQTKVVAAA
jgi:hypothetical protein